MCLHGDPNFRVDTLFGTPGGTTIVEMDNTTILNVDFEDQPEDHKIIITKAAEEYHDKCLLPYGKIRDKVIQNVPLPRVLHG